MHENFNFLPSSIASKNSSVVLIGLFKDVKLSPTSTNSLISDIAFLAPKLITNTNVKKLGLKFFYYFTFLAASVRQWRKCELFIINKYLNYRVKEVLSSKLVNVLLQSKLMKIFHPIFSISLTQ